MNPQPRFSIRLQRAACVEAAPPTRSSTFTNNDKTETTTSLPKVEPTKAAKKSLSGTKPKRSRGRVVRDEVSKRGSPYRRRNSSTSRPRAAAGRSRSKEGRRPRGRSDDAADDDTQKKPSSSLRGEKYSSGRASRTRSRSVSRVRFQEGTFMTEYRETYSKEANIEPSSGRARTQRRHSLPASHQHSSRKVDSSSLTTNAKNKGKVSVEKANKDSGSIPKKTYSTKKTKNDKEVLKYSHSLLDLHYQCCESGKTVVSTRNKTHLKRSKDSEEPTRRSSRGNISKKNHQRRHSLTSASVQASGKRIRESVKSITPIRRTVSLARESSYDSHASTSESILTFTQEQRTSEPSKSISPIRTYSSSPSEKSHGSKEKQRIAGRYYSPPATLSLSPGNNTSHESQDNAPKKGNLHLQEKTALVNDLHLQEKTTLVSSAGRYKPISRVPSSAQAEARKMTDNLYLQAETTLVSTGGGTPTSRVPSSAQAEARNMTEYVRRSNTSSPITKSRISGASRDKQSRRASSRIPRNLSMPALQSHAPGIDNKSLVTSSSMQEDEPSYDNDRTADGLDSKRDREMSDRTLAGWVTAEDFAICIMDGRKNGRANALSPTGTVYSAKEAKEDSPNGPVYNAYCPKEMKDDDTRASSHREAFEDSCTTKPPLSISSSPPAAAVSCNSRRRHRPRRPSSAISKNSRFDSLEEDLSASSTVALLDESQGWELHFDEDDLNEPLWNNPMPDQVSVFAKLKKKHAAADGGDKSQNTSKTSSTVSYSSSELYNEDEDVTSIVTYFTSISATTEKTVVFGHAERRSKHFQ